MAFRMAVLVVAFATTAQAQVTKVHFTEPGTYRLRAIANDGALSTSTDVVVTVR